MFTLAITCPQNVHNISLKIVVTAAFNILITYVLSYLLILAICTGANSGLTYSDSFGYPASQTITILFLSTLLVVKRKPNYVLGQRRMKQPVGFQQLGLQAGSGQKGDRDILSTASYIGYCLYDLPALYLNKKYNLKADKQLLLI